MSSNLYCKRFSFSFSKDLISPEPPVKSNKHLSTTFSSIVFLIITLSSLANPDLLKSFIVGRYLPSLRTYFLCSGSSAFTKSFISSCIRRSPFKLAYFVQKLDDGSLLISLSIKDFSLSAEVPFSIILFKMSICFFSSLLRGFLKLSQAIFNTF